MKASNQAPAAANTANPAEIAKFAALASQWWDANGPMKPLHALNPARLGYIRQVLVEAFGRDAAARRPLEGLAICDLGCGAGLVTEPLARLGAAVTGVDAAAESIAAAKAHAAQSGLEIDYRASRIELLKDEKARFDGLLILEVVEHVADLPTFLAACHDVLKPGGVLVFSTPNRTAASFLSVIVGAEYVLRWLPRGTHDWQAFLTPEEFKAKLATAGFQVKDVDGIEYAPLTQRWAIGRDVSVNYIGWAVKA
jgi:2-polyprenyl-6-hydroxyphenyl methylase / 3-demethylubiquinone-9 3-methyltransferase